MKASRKKHIIIMSVIGLVYFLGVAAIIYPIIGNMYAANSSKSTIKSYEKAVEMMPPQEIRDKFSEANQYNRDLAEGIYEDGFQTALNGEQDLMCYVDYPKLHIYIPVFYGTSTEVLKKGCGWLENTSLPVGGTSVHAAISGHTGLPEAEMFSHLDQASEGDLFLIHVLDRILAYRVDHIETVRPNDTKFLEIVPGEDHVTLLTCTPYGINDKRLLVRGVRVDYESPDSEESGVEEIRQEISSSADRVDENLQKQINRNMTIVTVIVVVATVLFVAACLWLAGITKYRSATPKYEKKKRSEEAHDEAKKE